MGERIDKENRPILVGWKEKNYISRWIGKYKKITIYNFIGKKAGITLITNLSGKKGMEIHVMTQYLIIGRELLFMEKGSDWIHISHIGILSRWQAGNQERRILH
ncbi:hypothetical protein ACJX0J_027661, partial [Zea mays]